METCGRARSWACAAPTAAAGRWKRPAAGTCCSWPAGWAWLRCGLSSKSLLADRDQYGRLVLLYGARQPADLLYVAEYPEWERQGMEVAITVDHADAAWNGRVGVVPVLLRRLSSSTRRERSC